MTSLCILSPSFASKPLTPTLAFRINCTVILKLIPNCFTTTQRKGQTNYYSVFTLQRGILCKWCSLHEKEKRVYFPRQMLPRQSGFLRGEKGSGDAVKIWSLHLASNWLLIHTIIANTLHSLFIFKKLFLLSSGQQRLKGMFRALAGSTLQLQNLRARGVSWWKAKSLSYADLQDVLFATFPGRENIY